MPSPSPPSPRRTSPKNKVRFVTATSLFDGHDASVNIMRRILQASGAEVIHLGHNRSVQEIVNAALQEDVQGIAITSYQGGHVEFFKYMIDLLRQNGGENIKVFGGGGGVIVASEIRELQAYGVTRLYSPEDGAKMGLQGMIDDVIRLSDYDLCALAPAEREALAALRSGDRRQLARIITAVENRAYAMRARQALLQAAAGIKMPVLGITGTGGAGKSSLTDELILRLRLDQDDRLRVAVISIDPSRKRTGGALLGDRIRMNAIDSDKIFMRSLGDARHRHGALRGASRSARLLQAQRLRPDRGRDLGHRPGRIGHRAAGRCLALRHDPGIRRGLAAREDRHARLRRLRRHQQVRPQGRGGCAARRAQAVSAQPRPLSAVARYACRCSAPWPRASTTTVSPRCTRPCVPTPAGAGPRSWARRSCRALAVKASSRGRAIVPPERVRYLAEIAETVRDYHRPHRAPGAHRARAPVAANRAARCSRRRASRARTSRS